MNNPYIGAILAVTSLAFGPIALAQNMSKSEYEAGYAMAREKCNALSRDAMEYRMNETKTHHGR